MNYIWNAIVPFISGGVGAYLGSYLKKKGENLATHEDIDKLVDQIKAVTQATKEIEAKISNEMWDRQKRWEIKKDAIFETMKELGTVKANLIELMSAYQVSKGRTDDLYLQARNRVSRKYQEGLLGFERARMVAMLVAGKDLQNKFRDFVTVAAEFSRDIVEEKDIDNHARLKEVIRCLEDLVELIRKDLEN